MTGDQGQKGIGRPIPSDQFVVTYQPVARMWCRVCEKTTLLDDLTPIGITAAQREHQCGPRTSAWTSRGLA